MLMAAHAREAVERGGRPQRNVLLCNRVRVLAARTPLPQSRVPSTPLSPPSAHRQRGAAAICLSLARYFAASGVDSVGAGAGADSLGAGAACCSSSAEGAFAAASAAAAAAFCFFAKCEK